MFKTIKHKKHTTEEKECIYVYNYDHKQTKVSGNLLHTYCTSQNLIRIFVVLKDLWH